MKRNITPAILSLLFVLLCSHDHGDWKYYDDWPVGADINDNTSYGIGVGLNESDSLLGCIITEIEFEVDIDHEAPATLQISLIYNDDTIPIWTDDFPGGIQTFIPSEIIGRPANAFYCVMVSDERPDEREGVWHRCKIKFNY